MNGVARVLALIPLILGLSLNAARANIELPVIKLNQETLLGELAGPWDDTSSEPSEDDSVVCITPPTLNRLGILQSTFIRGISPNFGPLEISLKPVQMGVNFRFDLMKSYEILSESRSPKEFISAFNPL